MSNIFYSKPIIITFAIYMLIFSTILYKRCAGSLKLTKLNVISLIYYSTIIYQLIGSLLLALGLVDNWWIDLATNNKKNVIIGFYATYISFTTLPIIIIIFQKMFNINVNMLNSSLYEKDLEYVNGSSDKIIRGIMVIILFILTLLLVILLLKTPDIPLLKLIKGGDENELAVARRATSISIGNLLYIKSIFGKYISPFVSLICFGYYLIKRSKINLILFIYSFCISSFFLFYDLSKAPILNFILYLVIYYGIYKGKIKKKVILKIATIFLVVLMIMYIMIMRSESISTAINSIIERVFIAQYAGTVLTFDYFPFLHDYLHGGVFVPFGSKINSIDSTSYALLTMEYYNKFAWEAGKAGYLCSQYIAEGYANFGYMGLILANIILALWISLFNLITIKVRKTPVSVAVISYLSVSAMVSKNNSLVFFVYDAGVISILLLQLSLYMLAGNNIYNKNKTLKISRNYRLKY